MRTVGCRWTAFFLIAAVSLLAASAVAAEPEAFSIGRYMKTGQVIDLAQQKIVEMPKEKQNLLALLGLGKSETPLVCYEKSEGGIVGFLGSVEVVFADGAALEELKKLPAEKWTEAFAQFKPITPAESKKFKSDDPKKTRPRNPVAMAPTVQVAPVVGRPSNFVACKAKDKMYLVEIVEQSGDGDTVTLKVHAL